MTKIKEGKIFIYKDEKYEFVPFIRLNGDIFYFDEDIEDQKYSGKNVIPGLLYKFEVYKYRLRYGKFYSCTDDFLKDNFLTIEESRNKKIDIIFY